MDNREFYGPNASVLRWVNSRAQGRVLEIGPGDTPFAKATHFVDRALAPNTTVCDVSREGLPFADKSFDFIYCRHVLEDLCNPFLLCEEMQRVGKAGYIETPSVTVELTRGVDPLSPPWRGYHHHHWFVVADGNVLCFAPKMPIVEHITFEGEETWMDELRRTPLAWNMYFPWKDTFGVRHLQHDIDFTLYETFKPLLIDARDLALRSAKRMGLVLNNGFDPDQLNV